MHTPKITDLGHGIHCIDTEMERPGLAACYLIREGSDSALIDTGPGISSAGVLAALNQLGVAWANVRFICPTHVHLDHGGGAGALMEALSGATLVAHPRAAPHFIDPSKIRAGAAAVYGEEGMKASFGEIIAVPGERVLAAEDGFALELNGRRLVFLDAPGHARHHYVVWDERSRGFFSGDTFGISYREFDTDQGPFLFPTTTPVQFEPEAWNTTLDRMLGFGPERMYLTHYGMVEDVQRLAEVLRMGIKRYCEVARALANADQRHERLKQVLYALTLAQLTAHGCALPETTQRELLATDMELNAQGLGVWLDREAKRSG